MRVKFLSRNLNSNPCPPHPTNTYTCGVTTAPRVHSDKYKLEFKFNYTYIHTYIYITAYEIVRSQNLMSILCGKVNQISLDLYTIKENIYYRSPGIQVKIIYFPLI